MTDVDLLVEKTNWILTHVEVQDLAKNPREIDTSNTASPKTPTQLL